MHSAEPAREAPELSASDLQWLREAIGVELRDDWKSADYVRAIEAHLEKHPERRLSDRDPEGNTPLHLVALSQDYAALEALLMCGADANATNARGLTPVTHSHQCPDYAVGFQFYRHLHKLAFLGQRLHRDNSVWRYDVGKTYGERYRRHGHLAAFTHDASLSTETICRIQSAGEGAICAMYQEELLRIRIAHTRKKRRTLDKVVDLSGRQPVAENRLKELRHFTSHPLFHKNFPLFGCVIKMMYRQSLELAKSRGVEGRDAPSSNHNPVDPQQVAGSDYARSLRHEEERRMREFVAREDTVVVGLMSDLKIGKRADEQIAADNCGSTGRSVSPSGTVDGTNSDEKVERMRRRLANLHRPTSQS